MRTSGGGRIGRLVGNYVSRSWNGVWKGCGRVWNGVLQDNTAIRASCRPDRLLSVSVVLLVGGKQVGNE